ncbi:DMT family transporter [Sphaerochaeta sp. PS]|uniref:DMT family transporter n=1 Tax=Sphaerochaeta sp. PS TaxID=3076336 RepID=UPI0028A475CC|nr:DMT family transporter [Sphaerochaeta sp. PS]MDT4761565.1 DMT family transporter [Sphaerochaeta sp. PS]
MKRTVFENPRLAILIAIFCNLLWATPLPMIKIGYQLFAIGESVSSKLLFAGIRFFSSGVLLLVYHRLSSRTWATVHRQNYLLVLILALVQTTGQYFFAYLGVAHTTGAAATIFSSVSACYAVVLAHFFFKDDKLTVQKVVGSLVCVFGIFISTLGEGTIRFSFNGEGFLLLSQLCFAFGSIFSKKITRTDGPLAVTAINLTLGGLLLILIGLGGGGSLPVVSLSGILVLAYLVFVSAMAFTLWSQLLKYNPVGKISVFTFIIPIAGTLFSALVLGEDIMHVKYPISLALVTAGIYAIYWKQKKVARTSQLPS